MGIHSQIIEKDRRLNISKQITPEVIRIPVISNGEYEKVELNVKNIDESKPCKIDVKHIDHISPKTVRALDTDFFNELLKEFEETWTMPNISVDKLSSSFEGNDMNLISLKESEDKIEISLNTSTYKPQELKVQVKEDAVKVEGKHEEESEDSQVIR